ncbi:hypothetical protein [Qaidamihabitans albus]|uniref:hypothetical protein n=1 Tax=Qaidamihabitans albus TaxID=2795733 RepID=UPI0018F16D2C|nr:hypothetical protein [Qaidamihabitans albus]
MTTEQVRFFGGPLDGRTQSLDLDPVRGSILRHVHLHDGPKIETYYQLGYTAATGWSYRLCGLPLDDETAEPDEVGER